MASTPSNLIAVAAPVIDGKTVGIDFVDSNARLALEFIGGTIAEARRLAVTT